MGIGKSIIRLCLVLTAALVAAAAGAATLPPDSAVVAADSVSARADSVAAARADSVAAARLDSLAAADAARIDSMLQAADSLHHRLPDMVPGLLPDSLAPIAAQARRQKRDWNTWRPDPKRALWLALVFPGGGQIYNRKYWKLPIVYGGFVGCVYALMWNNMMYKDYAQAYLDLMDDDPGTASYNKFLHLGRQITPENEERYKTIFKNRKDKFRRWRDLSFFVMVGIYAVSVIDAYVDAELSNFDISKDLSLRLEPAVIPMGTATPSQSARPSLGGSNALGLQCSLNF